MIDNKKGQGLSMNTIIIAVLALLVLAVLTFALFRYVGSTTNSLDSCVDKGGNVGSDGCTSLQDCNSRNGINLGSQFCDGNDVCCKVMGK